MSRFFLMSIIFTSLFLQPLSAGTLPSMNLGKDGEVVEKEGMSWQPVKLVWEKGGFRALLPGEYRGGTTSMQRGITSCAVLSSENGTFFQVSSKLVNYTDPGSKEQFLDALARTCGPSSEVLLLEPKQVNVKYVVQIKFYKEGIKEAFVTNRFFFSRNNHLYVATVQGEDQSLANAFFDSVKIQ